MKSKTMRGTTRKLIQEITDCLLESEKKREASSEKKKEKFQTENREKSSFVVVKAKVKTKRTVLLESFLFSRNFQRAFSKGIPLQSLLILFLSSCMSSNTFSSRPLHSVPYSAQVFCLSVYLSFAFFRPLCLLFSCRITFTRHH